MVRIRKWNVPSPTCGTLSVPSTRSISVHWPPSAPAVPSVVHFVIMGTALRSDRNTPCRRDNTARARSSRAGTAPTCSTRRRTCCTRSASGGCGRRGSGALRGPDGLEGAGGGRPRAAVAVADDAPHRPLRAACHRTRTRPRSNRGSRYFCAETNRSVSMLPFRCCVRARCRRERGVAHRAPGAQSAVLAGVGDVQERSRRTMDAPGAAVPRAGSMVRCGSRARRIARLRGEGP